jgi:exopolysaccharide production protein ExoQ
MKLAQVIVCIACLLFLPIVWPDLRSLRFETQKLDLAWLISICGWPFVVILAVAPLLLGAARVGAGQQLVFLEYGPALILGVFAFLRRLSSTPSRVSLASLLLFCAAIALLPFSDADPRGALITLTLYLPTILVVPRRDPFTTLARAARLSIAAILVAMTYMVTVFPDMSLEPCREDKCGISGVGLVSTYSGNGNIYGIVLVLLLPLAIYGLRLNQTIALVISVCLVSDICLSRTADIGLAFVVIGAFVLAGGRQTRSASVIIGTLFLGSIVMSGLPFWSTYDGYAYSFRGMLWEKAINMLLSSPLLGSGPSAWTGLPTSGYFNPNYSPHNIWLGLLTWGGLFLVSAVISAFALVVFALGGLQRLCVLLYLTAVLVIGTFEAPILPLSLGILPFVWLVALWVSSSLRTVSSIENSTPRNPENNLKLDSSLGVHRGSGPT